MPDTGEILTDGMHQPITHNLADCLADNLRWFGFSVSYDASLLS